MTNAGRANLVRHRAPNGTGSVYRRSDGRWRVKLGKLVDETLPKRLTRGQATTIARQLFAAAREGQLVGSGRQRVGVFLASWLDAIAPRKVTPRTLERYEGIVRLYLIPKLGRLRLDELSAQHIDRLHAACLQRVSPSTVRIIHACLRSALRYALSARLIRYNPADGASPPRASRPRTDTLHSDEVRTLFAGLAGHPHEALYVLAITTGARLGELLGLQWRDVDLEAGRISIRRALSRTKAGWALREPKTASSRRTVVLPEIAIAALRRHRTLQKRQRLIAGEAWGNHDLLYTDDWGEPLRGQHITEREFKPLLKTLGLPPVRFHDMRHTAATLLFEQGVHPKVVSEMLGHSSVEITLDTYSHVLPSMQEHAARAMADALRGM